MQETNLTHVEKALRTQHRILSELIESALSAFNEYGDTSVAAIHLATKLGALRDALKGAQLPAFKQAPSLAAARPGTRRK
jgi:hypothetical protein